MSSIIDYDYELDSEFIAQLPSEKRHDSKLMVLNRATSSIEDRLFHELIDILEPGDLLVLNNAKVIPARLIGKKVTGGKVEIFLLQDRSKNKDIYWEVLVKPGIKVGTNVVFSDKLSCEVINVLDDGKRLVRFDTSLDFLTVIDELGQIPLPPYVNYDETKSEYYKQRYQTVFADKFGAAAAPTAGLHFTNDLFENLADKGVEIAYLTLYVGIGTFRPIKCDNYLEHTMHSETYELPAETVDKINEIKSIGGRVIAVGTTTTRVLEGVYNKQGQLKSGIGSTDIFIHPGFEFQVIDSMITNFHLPKSSLLLMISAFANKEFIMGAYERAKVSGYRFFSFGDAMLIV
ncbi:MAG: tRNA preQ1(34) S-adenosylmethionine ribosyltransferase-isomerase QueA [Candidatus Riflemargulisbacteria bacterium]